jgi:hypothetical protein
VSLAGVFASSALAAYAKLAVGRMALLCDAYRMGGGTIKHCKRGVTDAGASPAGLIWSKSHGCGQRASYLPLLTWIMIRPTIGLATCAVFVSAAT